MKKKIIALLLTLVMVLGIVPAAVLAADPAPKATFTYTPDKTEAKPGDVINYTLTMEWESGMLSFAFRPVFPEGMTYVAGSGKIAEGARDALSYNEVAWTEKSLVISGYGDYVAELPNGEPFVLATFQAKLADDAAIGEYEMDYDADKMEVVDENFEWFTSSCVNSAKVTIAPEPLGTFTFDADKTTVTRGDIINYTFLMEWKNPMLSFAARPVFPAGLEYVAGSGKVVEGAKEALEYNEVAWTEKSFVISGYGDYAADPTTAPFALVTFQVKVADDAAFGTYAVDSDDGKAEICDENFESAYYDLIKVISDEITVIDHKCTAAMLTPVAAVDATCTTAGNIAHYECSECGLLYADANAENALTDDEIVVDALGHTEGEWIETTAPDCTNAGEETLYCAVCEEAIDTRVVDALGHTEGEWVIDPDATCTEDGEKTISCTVCNEVLKTEIIPEKGHSYESVVTDPTCVDKGYTTYTCSACNDSYVDDYVDELGHTAAAEWVETTAPDCTNAGEETLYCSVCNEALDTREVEALGHTEGEWIETTAPDCTNAGEETLYCSVCNEVLDTREVEALGHTDGEWVETTAPDCTNAGEETLYCAVCEEAIDTREVEALGHTEEEIPAVAPTCTETGLTAGTKCSVCDEILVAQEVIAANGHTDGEWVNTTAPTCTEAGEDTLYCAVCEEAIDTREVEALGHEYESVVTDPTCTEDGYTTWTCHCGDTYTDTVVPAIGHDIPDTSEWAENPEEPGWYYGYCKNGCGYAEKELRTIFVKGVKLDQDYVETYYVRSAPAFTLTAFVQPEDASEAYTIAWTSSNEEVATVDEDGNVTTHKRGDAVITVTVTSADGETSYSASCAVKVKYNWWQWLIWIFLFGCLWYFI